VAELIMYILRITDQNGDKVAASVASTDDRVIKALGVGLARALLIAVGIAQVNYLSGPRPGVLDVITGRLRGNVASEVEISGNQVTGRIGDNMPYAAFWEFGFQGTEQVAEHTRVTSISHFNGSVYVLQHGGTKRQAKRSLKRNDIVGFSVVRAHTRTINNPGRPFIRPALERTDIGGEIAKELQKEANNG
jgi:hypothetical protein